MAKVFKMDLRVWNSEIICCSFYSIENQHVQFKVDANPQNVDAAKVAEVLEEDINLKKRLTDTLGVDVANVAASHRVRIQWFSQFFYMIRSLKNRKIVDLKKVPTIDLFYWSFYNWSCYSLSLLDFWTCRQLNLLNSILCTIQKWSSHSVVKLLKSCFWEQLVVPI